MSGLFAGTSLERPVTCEKCGKTHALCDCARGSDGKVLDPKTQQVRVRREKRRGKIVTVVGGFAKRSAKTDDLKVLLGALKKKLGAGGSLGEDEKGAPEIEVQGDHRDVLVQQLIAMGYPAKAAGG
jgi:translation initiation factor 1